MASGSRCSLCGGDIAASRCAVCGAPALPGAELRQKPPLYIVVTAIFGAIMFISGALALLPLDPLLYGLAITAFATSASLGGIVWITGNWLRPTSCVGSPHEHRRPALTGPIHTRKEPSAGHFKPPHFCRCTPVGRAS